MMYDQDIYEYDYKEDDAPIIIYYPDQEDQDEPRWTTRRIILAAIAIIMILGFLMTYIIFPILEGGPSNQPPPAPTPFRPLV